MNIYISIAIWAGVILAAFIIAWRAGQITKLADYIRATREELRKCAWPTWDELKGSTIVVAISIVLLGGLTVGLDFVFAMVMRAII
jgi:preprotein translocase subunit SecE